MRNRAGVLLTAVVAAASLAVGASAVGAGASVSSKTVAVCAGNTKGQAVKDIKKAYDYFLNGAKYPTSAEKEPYIQGLSGKNVNAELKAQFEASATANAAASATTSVKVNKVTCKGKKNAGVAFDLVLNGKPSPGLAPAGSAVLEGSTWKVTSLTVCDLEALGDSTITEKPPCSTIQAGG